MREVQSAERSLPQEAQEKVQVFMYTTEIDVVDIRVPTVVEFAIQAETPPSVENVVVYDYTDQTFLPARGIRALQVTAEEKTQVNSVRFLAQPGHTYSVFYGADRAPNIQTEERPDLKDSTGVKDLGKLVLQENSFYTQPDQDEDGISDVEDNCVSIKNPEQIDKNNNGKGDACEDFDRDGIINAKDNCKSTPNRAQTDVDNDGKGNACDETDNRIFEGNEWLPWGVLGGVAIILLGMLGWIFTKMAPHSNTKE